MEKKKKKIIIGTFVTLILIGAACAGTVYYYLFAPQFHPQKTVYIYIDRDDTADSIYNKVKQQGHPRSFTGFRWMAQYKKYSENIHTGRYAIRPGENVYHVFSRLYRGYQEPMNLTVGSVRTLDRLARSISKQLMIDSAEIAGLMNDSAFQQKLGYTKETLPCLFIPETYQVYWDMSVEEFFERMQKEHQRFWNQERLGKATAIGMTPTEICTLASIVEEETNNNPEKPMVAGLYINRLHKGWPLQADPTIKYAMQDFGLRRILYRHLKYESPYNTYLHRGLPPSPICMPSIAAIDAVLDYEQNDYIYFCARPTFDGYHNFARTLAEHNANARAYQRELNKRKIK